MQEFRPSVHNQSPSLPDGTLHSMRASFTPLRVGLVLAAALLIATAIIILRGGAAGQRTGNIQREQSFVSHTTTSEITQNPKPNTTPTSTTFSSTTNGGSTSTHLTVNGQDVPVPQDGNTHQTTIDQNGARTSVDASASQSSVTNTSTINVHINSSTSATGGTGQ